MQKKCPACPHSYAAATQVCPFCGTRYEEAVASARAEGREMPIRMPRAGSRHREMVVMGADVRRGREPTQLKLSWVVALVAVVGFAIWTLRPNRLPLETLTSLQNPTAIVCDGRPTCVVVYVAPWDPVSRQTVKSVQRLREEWADSDEVGLAIVVGNDSRSRIADLADAIGENSWTDYSESVFQAAEIETLPTWFRVDSKGKIQARVDGTYRPAEYQLRKLGFTGY